MHKDDLRQLLIDCAAERLAILQRHEASARVVSHYDFNNTYQYVIAREEMHVSWVADAVQDASTALGVSDVRLEDVAEPQITASGKGAQASVIAQDRDGAQAFVDKWKPLVAKMTQARHRTMLNVVLGETLEHKRFFDQILAGREDMLGRRSNGPGSPGTGDGVLPVRWIE